MLEESGPLLFSVDDADDVPPFEPYSRPLMVELQRRGIEFVVDGVGEARHVGSRRLAPEKAVARIFVRLGDAAFTVPDGAERVAFASGVTAEQRDELVERQAAVEAILADKGIPLNDRGRLAVDAGELPWISAIGTAPIDDAYWLLASRELLTLVQSDMLDLEPEQQVEMWRYAELRAWADKTTVAVFLAPVEERRGDR